jgi:NAD(P)H-dependent flavin oxidoreductase YrpB (nitropropane dioxygenase family)
MNGVSDLKLALSVFKAGAFPSLSLSSYRNNGKINYNLLVNDLSLFQKISKGKNLLFSVPEDNLNSHDVLEALKMVSHCELLHRAEITTTQRKNNFEKIKNLGCKVLLKSTSYLDNLDFYDGLIFKSSKAAGRIGNTTDSLDVMLIDYKQKFPEKCLIPSGGIHSKSQILQLMEIGACAVGIGTLFAFSKESKVSEEAKLKVVSSFSKDVKEMVGKYNKQNALILSHVESEEMNHTESLYTGLNSGSQGHILAGTAIDYIYSIKSVKEIINDLTL